MFSAPFKLLFLPPSSETSSVFALEAATFERSYGVSYDDHCAEFAPYADASAFLAVVDSAGSVASFMRLVTPGPAGLKTLVEAGGQPWAIDGLRAARAVGVDPQRTWDVASLGVARGVGRHRFAVTAALYRGLTLAVRRNRVQSLLMTVDERVRSILAVFGLVTTALPGARPGPFCGSPASTPVFGHCAQMLQVQRRSNPESYRLVTQGIGLEHVQVPPLDAFDLTRRPAPAAVPGVEPVSAPVPAAV